MEPREIAHPWPALGSPEDAEATHRWARACLEDWEREREHYRAALRCIERRAQDMIALAPGEYEEAGEILDLADRGLSYTYSDSRKDTECSSDS